MKDFNINDFRENLFALRDDTYRIFNARIIAAPDENFVIGVKIPVLRRFTKNFFAETNPAEFLSALPHKFHEENLAHAFIVSEMKDYAECLAAIKEFLPYIDNWGVCDTFKPKIFKRHLDELEPEILNWLQSDREFTVRFGLSMLMKFYLDARFDVKYLDWAAGVKAKSYYAKMMAAWFFATALAKHFDEAKVYLEERRLSRWIHNKTIQKACESFRISDEQKKYLRGLKI